ncbi:hypothetical protein BH20CHL7_BH20CHL7_16680 [soil metagenome]
MSDDKGTERETATDSPVRLVPSGRSVLDFAGLAAGAAARIPATAEGLDALIDRGLTAQAVERVDAVR